MALLRLDHVPESVGLNLPLYVILPEPAKMGGVPVRRRKVLYLLHGLSDDGSAWQRFTSIETLADRYGLVVVMPSVGRSFYADLPSGQLYFTYLMEELPRYLSDVFGIEPKREDTLIAGNSMGGYGAFKAAFTHPERFIAAASFSGVLMMEFIRSYRDTPLWQEFSYVFGDIERVYGSLHDPAIWFAKAAQAPSQLPMLFISCGRQEDLYPINQQVHAALVKMGIRVAYYEEDALHDWFNWDREIRRFLETALGPVPES